MIENKPKPPIAGIIYGEIVYWGVLAGSLIVIVGSVLAFLGDNFVPVSYWISSIWKGETVLKTWQGATGSLPNGHWYLSHLTTGDGLSALGISLGVFSVVPALFLSSVALFREKEWLYGALAMVGCIVVIIGVLGLAPMPK
jgi:hypothetical protein